MRINKEVFTQAADTIAQTVADYKQYNKPTAAEHRAIERLTTIERDLKNIKDVEASETKYNSILNIIKSIDEKDGVVFKAAPVFVTSTIPGLIDTLKAIPVSMDTESELSTKKQIKKLADDLEKSRREGSQAIQQMNKRISNLQTTVERTTPVIMSIPFQELIKYAGGQENARLLLQDLNINLKSLPATEPKIENLMKFGMLKPQYQIPTVPDFQSQEEKAAWMQDKANALAYAKDRIAGSVTQKMFVSLIKIKSYADTSLESFQPSEHFSTPEQFKTACNQLIYRLLYIALNEQSNYETLTWEEKLDKACEGTLFNSNSMLIKKLLKLADNQKYSDQMNHLDYEHLDDRYTAVYNAVLSGNWITDNHEFLENLLHKSNPLSLNTSKLSLS